MSARDNILAKLRKANAYPMAEPQTEEYYQEMSPEWENDVERLKHWAKAMRAVKTEIFWVHENDWETALVEVAKQKELKNVLLPQTADGTRAQKAFQAANIATKAFDTAIDGWKDEMFLDISAGFSAAHCGIANTGTLMLLSSPGQPRTLSLVPPVHICLFDTSKMYGTFYAALQGEKLADNMPTNAILVSGPSKTADIQLTLAYGAHGPRDLVVLAVLPKHIKAEDLAE
ncbi:LutC/YkgG family protein [Kingella negevensis]|uniref:LutC/YkgG family protein n=1 Tax=Kingella negevensis TaxID=1522312 RepID=UPI002549F748|nr:lactate utilization protein C [Kingella negevensis]MDK4679760.1 lactate utilization protein C [Kingella negevensis]MDK4682522.1 lactate utilization protein C [Kingella negevensis]MDK4690718.1 lactate utilization protein C [Kingella negevensis]MDK4694134.1 lactate utilization protein C [Kingella negevensis]MDK4699863.1 lactate utilization protein C [Kingella negevensis]